MKKQIKWAIIILSLLVIFNPIASATTDVISSNGTWTAPTGLTSVNLTVVGSGGGGASGDCANGPSGSGGSAGTSTTYNNVAVTPGNGYAIIIGPIGRGGAAASPIGATTCPNPRNHTGTNGGTTSFNGAQTSAGGNGATTFTGSNGGAGNTGIAGYPTAPSGGTGTATNCNSDPVTVAGSSGGAGFGAGGGGGGFMYPLGCYGGGATGAGGNGAAGVVAITYTIPPTADWVQNITSGSSPLVVQFMDTSVNAPTSWSWNFGDGNTSTSQNPTKTYNVLGTFNVTLIVTNAGGSNTAFFNRSVVVGTTTDPTNTRLYLPFNGTDGSKQILDMSGSNKTVINFGNVTISTADSKFGGSSLKFNGGTFTTGSQLVFPAYKSLTLSNNNFYIGWWEKNYIRPPGSAIIFGIRYPDHIVYNYAIGHSDDGENIRNYLASNLGTTGASSWNIISSGIQGTASPQVWSYYVLLRNGSDFKSYKNGTLLATYTCSVVGGCAINSSNGTPTWIGTYSGNPGDVGVRYIDDFIYINGTALDGTIVPTRELLTNPTADFLISNTTGQFPLLVKFTDISQGNTPTFWNWSFGDGSFSSIQNPSHTYANIGNYSVILNVSNTFGFDNTSSKYINVSPKMITNFTANVTNGISPLPIQFTDQTTNATGWSWFFGDEAFNQPYITQSSSPPWIQRGYISATSLPNGTIIMTGGATAVGANGDIWKSINKGITWSLVNATSDWGPTRYGHQMVTLPNNNLILMGGYNPSFGFMNDVWSSTDGGNVWNRINASAGWLPRYLFSSTVTSDGTIIITGGVFGALYLNDTWKSTDGGFTWSQTSASSGWEIRSMSQLTSIDNTLILVGGLNQTAPVKVYKDIWRSTNYGVTWTQLPNGGFGTRYGGSLLTLPDKSMVLIGGVNETLWQDTWRSQNRGDNWSLINTTSIYRYLFGSTVLPDGSIIATGGAFATYLNDTLRFNPVTSSTQNPMHTYSIGGLYNVSLRTIDAFSFNTTSKVNYTQVITGSTANFTINTTVNSIYPLVILFNDTSSGLPATTWNWSFGDGRWFNTTDPLQKNVTYQYAVAQKYNVNLTVNSTLNTNTLSVLDAINLTADDDNNVTSWLHMNGTEGSTVFTDEKGVSWTNGASNASITNQTYKYGNSSLNLTGVRPFIIAAPVPAFNFSGNDFTIEFWTNISSTSTSNPLITKTNAGFTNGWGFYHISGATSSNWVFFMGAIANSSTPAITLPLNTWNHVAIERRSGTVFIYVNGMLNATLTGVSGSFDTLNNPVIGYKGPGNSNNFNGYVDEFRISNARARWWSNFTTPYNQYNGVVETQFPDINPNSTMRYKTDPGVGAIISNVTPRNRTIQIQCITYTNYVVGTSFFDNDHIFVKSVSLNTSFFATGMTIVSSTIDNTLGEITFNISRATGFNPGTSRASILDYQAIYWNYQDPNETNGNLFDPEDPAFNEQFLGSGYLINGSTDHFYPVHNFIATTVTYLPWNITSNFTVNNRTSVPNLPLVVSDDSYLYDSYPNQWNWSWGDGTWTNGTSNATTHSYTTSGIYNITDYTGINQNTSIINTTSKNVTIYDQTIAVINSNITTGLTPAPIQFDGTGSTNATLWNWSFGDGTFNNGTNSSPIHTYNSEGLFLVNLTTSSFEFGLGSNSQTGYLIDIADPIFFSDFTGTPNSGNQTMTVQFNVTHPIDNATAWNWTFGDGAFQNGTDQNTSHSYSTGGKYTITLNASNPATFNTTTKINYISVYNTTIASFTQNLFEFEVPISRTVLFNDTSINASWWNWSFFDGTWYNTTNLAAKNTSKLIDSDGNFTINLTTSDQGFGISTAYSYVNTTPIFFPITSILIDPPINITPIALIFANDTTVENTTQWNWSWGDGSWTNGTLDQISTVKNTTHSYFNKGTYPIYLIASNTNGTNQSDIFNLIVYSPVISGFNANVTNGYVPFHVEFNVTTIDDNATTWGWSFGDGSPPEFTQNVTHIYLTNGTFEVSEFASNPLDTNATNKTNYIMTNFTPIFASFAINPTHGNNPLTVSFSDTSTILSHADVSNGAPNTWLWLFGDGGSSALQNPTHTYTVNGLYSPSLFIGSSVTGNFDNAVCVNCINVIGSSNVSPATNANVIDIVNSSGLQEWMYYMIVTNKTGPWEFPVIGFASGVMKPFTSAFDTLGPDGGSYVYLLLWGLFIMMVWRQSGKITMPALIAVITAGAWGLLFPESAQPWIQLLLCAAIASQLFTFFTKE